MGFEFSRDHWLLSREDFRDRRVGRPRWPGGGESGRRGRVAAMSDVSQEVCSGRVMERWSGQSSRGKTFLYFFSIKQMRAHLEDQQKASSPEDRRGREGSYRSRVSRDRRVPLSPGAAYLVMLIES